MESVASKRLAIALLLCLGGAAVSGLLLLEHHGVAGAVSTVNEVCGEGETSGCETVARSPWSTVGGIPLAAVGVVYYLSLSLLLVLALVAPTEVRVVLAGLAVGGLALGLAVDLFLLGIQAFAVHAFCALCVLTYGLGAAALVTLLPARRGGFGLGGALRGAEGRLGIAGWALGTLALASAVLAAGIALDAREARGHLAMLGAPAGEGDAPAPRPTPGPPAEPEAATAHPGDPTATATTTEARTEVPSAAAVDWEARARELQATLDDPRKLEEYFSRKAQREYAAEPVERIDLENTAFRGAADAPVRVVEYSDFLCPFCRNLALGLAQFVPQSGGRVAVYFKNFPLDQTCNKALTSSTHPGACWLALGAVCAHRQGKFEAYHDRVFSAEGLRNPQPADVARLAGEAGLNAQAIEGCLSDPETERVLERQIEEGHRLGVHATPTLYVNGKKLPRINDFVAVVDAEAQKKGFPALAK